MLIFYKSEVRTVICVNLNWYKSYDTKIKNAKSSNEFLNKLELRPVKHLSFVTDEHTYYKKNGGNGRKLVIYKGH